MKSPPPQRLIDGLRARGAQVRVVADVPSVMVELALAAAQRGLPRILIVHDPGSVRRVDALLEAVRRYHPQARCWRFEGGVNGRASLRPMEPGVNGAGAGGGPEGVGARPGSLPQEGAAGRASSLRSAWPGGGRGEAGTARPAADQPLISAEELAMLLGPGRE